jgi:hypothetical protein
MRRATEFILRVKGVYTLADVRRMNFVTYFKVLAEAEQSEREAIARMEKNARHDG